MRAASRLPQWASPQRGGVGVAVAAVINWNLASLVLDCGCHLLGRTGEVPLVGALRLLETKLAETGGRASHQVLPCRDATAVSGEIMGVRLQRVVLSAQWRPRDAHLIGPPRVLPRL